MSSQRDVVIFVAVVTVLIGWTYPLTTILIAACLCRPTLSLLYKNWWPYLKAQLQDSESINQAIEDNYETLDELQKAMKKIGLESSKMIIGIDFTASNTESGAQSYGGKSLHYIPEDESQIDNPYYSVIQHISKTIYKYDEDGRYLCFGFGDTTTKKSSVFNLKNPKEVKSREVCNNLNEVVDAYKAAVKNVTLSGPTSFSPLIYTAIDRAKHQKGQYFILVIITDGATMTKKKDMEAIVKASKYPISIICIGVGDGPWDDMKEFDDGLPDREFDNFQLVIYNQVKDKGDNEFARQALMEIPEQYKAIKTLGYLE